MTMTPKSIILTADEVRAFLNTKVGVWPAQPIDPSRPWKWQHRQIIKNKDVLDSLNSNFIWDGPMDQSEWELSYASLGPIGRRVWVKETWRQGFSKTSFSSGIIYAADKEKSLGMAEYCGKMKSPVHMPYELSRLELEVKTIRVERVQDISEEDAIAEGIFFTDYGKTCYHNNQIEDYSPLKCNAPKEHHSRKPGWSFGKSMSPDDCMNSSQSAFGSYWISRHSPDSWNKNEWVFVYEFMRVR